jgi:integrase
MPKYRRGSGSIYKKRGWFYISFYVDGTKKAEAAHTKDRGEARALLNRRLGEVAAGRYLGPLPDRTTFDDLAALVVADYEANGKKTLKNAKRRIKKHLAPTFAGKRAKDISAADVQAFVAARKTAGAANGEINRELALLKRMFNLGLRADLVVKKPYIPHLEENNVRQGFFERAEFEKVLAELPDYLRPVFTFANATGWRTASEILPLTWDRIALPEGTVRLDPGSTKNKEGRVIYLTAELRAVIEEQWRAHLERWPDCPYVFTRTGKDRIRSYDEAWRGACRRAGLAGKIVHDFRRTAVRNMTNHAGIPERVAMQISGHKTRAIFDRYHIVSDGDMREAATRLDAALRSRTTTISTTMTPESADDAVHSSLNH